MHDKRTCPPDQIRHVMPLPLLSLLLFCAQATALLSPPRITSLEFVLMEQHKTVVTSSLDAAVQLVLDGNNNVAIQQLHHLKSEPYTYVERQCIEPGAAQPYRAALEHAVMAHFYALGESELERMDDAALRLIDVVVDIVRYMKTPCTEAAPGVRDGYMKRWHPLFTDYSSGAMSPFDTAVYIRDMYSFGAHLRPLL